MSAGRVRYESPVRPRESAVVRVVSERLVDDLQAAARRRPIGGEVVQRGKTDRVPVDVQHDPDRVDYGDAPIGRAHARIQSSGALFERRQVALQREVTLGTHPLFLSTSLSLSFSVDEKGCESGWSVAVQITGQRGCYLHACYY